MEDMIGKLTGSLEGQFLLNVLLCLFFGTMLGLERQYRGKAAGIRTYTYVILGSMIFTFLSRQVDENSPSRIAAQIVTGIGFLGAGLIIKDNAHSQIRNLAAAASLWYAGGIGMIIGFGMYTIAGVAAIVTFVVQLISRLLGRDSSGESGVPTETFGE